VSRWCFFTALALTFASASALAQPIDRVDLRGNRKVEDDAVRAILLSRSGGELDPDKIRADIRALWRTGWFEDVAVEAHPTRAGGVRVVYALTERPAVRKVVIAGNDHVKLEDLNEVLDLERGAILDPAAVARNRAAIRTVYERKGFTLAAVEQDVRPVDEDNVDVWYVVDERSRIEVASIDFLGNDQIEDAELRRVLTTGDTYARDSLDRDLLRVTAYYYDRGYARVRVDTPRLRLSRDKRKMYVTIPVDEGAVYRFADVRVHGDDPKVKLACTPGAVVAHSDILGDFQRIQSAFRDRGYAFATVEPRQVFDVDAHTLSLTFDVDKGRRVYVERINIRGATKTRDKVIRRELALAEGELFDQSALDGSRARVFALGYFASVNVATRRGSSPDLIAVDLEVSEQRTGTFNVGAGFSTYDTILANAQIEWNNFLGRGQSVQLSALISGSRRLYNLRFVEPHAFDTDWSVAFDLFDTRRSLGDVTRTATGGSLGFGRRLTDDVKAFVTYTYEEVGIDAHAKVANLYRGGATSSVRGSLQHDTRDNRLFPTRGQFHSVYAEVADEFTGSENVFTRFGVSSRYYRPVWGPFQLRLRGELGVVTSRDPLGVPITERYLLGGIHDIRGFEPGQLGPRIQIMNGDELEQLSLGGNLKIVTNTEIEFPVARAVGLSGVVFFDAGNAFNLEDRYCTGSADANPKRDPCFSPSSLIEGLRGSVGFGLRWASPMGPLRLEWGIPLDRQPGESAINMAFSIGSLF
jgi:outer membrane protein insertion porin family